MWSPLLEPSKLVLIRGRRGHLRAFHQELAHYALHHRPGTVLWCDGDHGFNPYHFAELNLARGYDADWGDERLLIKRCLTPFQWATVLNQHLQQKLLTVDAAMVLAAPYDHLFSSDELKDWEQEHYVEYNLAHLRTLARRHQVPIVISVDLVQWWKTNPILARMAQEGVDAMWAVRPSGDGWQAVEDTGQRTIEPLARRQTTLWDHAVAPEPLAVPLVARSRSGSVREPPF